MTDEKKREAQKRYRAKTTKVQYNRRIEPEHVSPMNAKLKELREGKASKYREIKKLANEIRTLLRQ